MSHQDPDRKAEFGFTLAELLVVVFVMAIVAAMAVPMAVGTGDMQVISAARMISADLQYAQNTAITDQEPVMVWFVPGTDNYGLSNESGVMIHPITKRSYVVDFRTREGFGNLDIVSSIFGGEQWVEFDELGTPNSGGTVTLRSGPHVYEVSVAPATGRVTVTATSP